MNRFDILARSLDPISAQDSGTRRYNPYLVQSERPGPPSPEWIATDKVIPFVSTGRTLFPVEPDIGGSHFASFFPIPSLCGAR
jgi:hypothetical protein